MHKATTAVSLPLLLLGSLAAQQHVSQAGAAQARLFASRGMIPPPATFVVADLLNERRHELRLPEPGEALALDLRFARAGARVFLQAGLAGGVVADRAALPPVNLAFAIDCSGSMQGDGKLERVRQALLAFTEQLRPCDRVALVAWSDAAELRVPSRPVGDLCELRRQIAELRPGGSTNLHGGLMCALAEVARTRAPGTNRVILLTDGIANRGVTDPKAIAADATLLAGVGIDVTTIGFGQDAQTALLREIAVQGHGAFHFVADQEDIAKVFVREAEGLLAPLARRVRLELALDPDLRVVRVLGPNALPGETLAFELEDMSQRATQVVLVELEATTTCAGKRRFPVEARLRYADARTGEPRTLTRVASWYEGEECQAAQDLDLLRNLAIARLGVAMREMAGASHEGRQADARRILSDALRTASADAQVFQHPDVARVMATASRYRDLLDLGGAASTDR